VTDIPLLDLSPSRHAQDGVAASDDKQYRYALWRFWDIAKPYILFVSLNPKSLKDSDQCEDIERWLENWEHRPDRENWRCGGYVLVSLFSRVAWTVAELRRLHGAGQDIASHRAADACLVFGRNPSCSLIVMMPGIDDMLDVREGHQGLVLDALAGLEKPIATVVNGAPVRWERG